MGACSNKGARGSAEEVSGLLGDPVLVDLKPGVSVGQFGHQEVVEQGKPTAYASNDTRSIFCGWLWVFLQWPFSSAVWGVVFLFQFTCAPCFYGACGNDCCLNPAQINYVHSLRVVYQTLLKGSWRYLCCCLHPQPGILFSMMYLPTPPRFLFDEDRDTAYLMTLDEYIAAKSHAFPPFSGKYRAIDGGGNNAEYTFVGQGGRGYGMTEPYVIINPSLLPDADALAADLFVRTSFKEAPFGQNAIACWFANVAIHDFFRSATGADNKWVGGVDKPWVNLHSGYLDIQPLYGFNKETAAATRSGTGGKLKQVAENRFTPRIPESWAIVEILRREHNWVCDQLAAKYPEQFKTDEELFQQARLIMGAVYIRIILRQYGDQMFGQNPPNGDVFMELRQRDFGWWPEWAVGKENLRVGNHTTFNFNIIYRWHTAPPAEWSALWPAKVGTDDELRKTFLDAYGQKAGGFGPNNVPTDMCNRMINVPALEIKRGRQCGVPRLNDFRKRFGKPYNSFDELTGDPELSKRLAKYYPTIWDVELVVGIQVERCMYGGWALPETAGHAILFDAFNSVCQDRFYTKDYTPEVYTPWGYEHAQNINLVDLLNRHLQMGLDRNMMLARVPSWKGPPEWSQMKNFPNNIGEFDPRGFPIMK